MKILFKSINKYNLILIVQQFLCPSFKLAIRKKLKQFGKYKQTIKCLRYREPKFLQSVIQMQTTILGTPRDACNNFHLIM